jgi:hypothetical protein
VRPCWTLTRWVGGLLPTRSCAHVQYCHTLKQGVEGVTCAARLLPQPCCLILSHIWYHQSALPWGNRTSGLRARMLLHQQHLTPAEALTTAAHGHILVDTQPATDHFPRPKSTHLEVTLTMRHTRFIIGLLSCKFLYSTS